MTVGFRLGAYYVYAAGAAASSRYCESIFPNLARSADKNPHELALLLPCAFLATESQNGKRKMLLGPPGVGECGWLFVISVCVLGRVRSEFLGRQNVNRSSRRKSIPLRKYPSASRTTTARFSS